MSTRPDLRQLAARAALTAVLVLASGCAGGQTYPTLSPISQAKSYGYSEQASGDDRYSVTYQGASKRVTNYPLEGQTASEAARNEALDFALWRAAQLAQQAGYEGFRVSDKRADVDVTSQPLYNDQNFYAPYGPSVGAMGAPRNNAPGLGSPGARAGAPESATAQIQAHATIAVELIHRPGPGDYGTAETLARLRATYPGAERGPS